MDIPVKLRAPFTKTSLTEHMLKAFRILSLIEGFSLITLLFIAMPAKYYFEVFDTVWIVGMIHGLLWIAYVLFSLPVSHKQGWSVMFWMFALISSVIPFGCFLLDYQLRKELTLESV